MLSYKFIDCSLRIMTGSLRKNPALENFFYQNNDKGEDRACPPYRPCGSCDDDVVPF
jgi:hypothetical protein